MSEIEKVLTPSEEEQVVALLKGKCPHNQGWDFYSYYHNGRVYKCIACGELQFY